MTTLECIYPAPLQSAVRHAERLSQVFSMPELAGRLDMWGVGRANEIARFVELIVCDWSTGRLSDLDAATELNAYVESLETGLCDRLQVPADGCAKGDSLFFS
jgi:hypothetical protein